MPAAETRIRAAWSDREIAELKKLARQNTPTRVIALKIGRTESSVRQKARGEGVLLKPWNQSPYGRVARRSKASPRSRARSR
jgi:hypothetical protein